MNQQKGGFVEPNEPPPRSAPDMPVSFACANLVSRGQTLFRTEGKGLGHDHRATCRPGI